MIKSRPDTSLEPSWVFVVLLECVDLLECWSEHRNGRHFDDHKNELLNVDLLVRKSIEQSAVYPVRSIEQYRICLLDRFDELLIFAPVVPVDSSSPQPIFLDRLESLNSEIRTLTHRL